MTGLKRVLGGPGFRQVNADKFERWSQYISAEYNTKEENIVAFALPADMTLLYGGQSDDFDFDGDGQTRMAPVGRPRMAYLVSSEKLMKASELWAGWVRHVAQLLEPGAHAIQELLFKNYEALPIFFAAVHGRDDMMAAASPPAFDTIFKVAVYCYELGVLGVVGPLVDGWIEGLYVRRQERAERPAARAEHVEYVWKMLWIAYEFGMVDMFDQLTLEAVKSGIGADLDSLSPQLPDGISQRIQQAESYLLELILGKFRAIIIDVQAAVSHAWEQPKGGLCAALQRAALVDWLRKAGLVTTQSEETIAAAFLHSDFSALEKPPVHYLVCHDVVVPEHAAARVGSWSSPYSGPALPASPPGSSSSCSENAAAREGICQQDGCCALRRFAARWNAERLHLVSTQLYLRGDVVRPMTSAMRMHLEAQRQIIVDHRRTMA